MDMFSATETEAHCCSFAKVCEPLVGRRGAGGGKCSCTDIVFSAVLFASVCASSSVVRGPICTMICIDPDLSCSLSSSSSVSCSAAKHKSAAKP